MLPQGATGSIKSSRGEDRHAALENDDGHWGLLQNPWEWSDQGRGEVAGRSGVNAGLRRGEGASGGLGGDILLWKRRQRRAGVWTGVGVTKVHGLP